MALKLLILQSTPFCNLDCDYCYLPDRQNSSRMSDETLGAALRRVVEAPQLLGDELTIVWHAGEPLVQPISYYERAMGIARAMFPPSVTVRHSFQTNATLLDSDWARFMRDNADVVRVGVSVDGPQALHDSRRKTRSGKGTHASVMRGIKHLQDAGVEFYTITVLTSTALSYPDEMYEFFVDSAIQRIGFNVEEVEGPHTSSSLQGQDTATRFRSFIRRFADLVAKGSFQMEVREFSGAMAALSAPKSLHIANDQVLPWTIMSVDHQGDFSTFSPELLGVIDPIMGSMTFGNVHSMSIAQASASPQFQRVHASIEEGVAMCRDSCQYFRLCGGGAPANKLFENKTFASTHTMYCRLTIQGVLDSFLEHVDGLRSGSSNAGQKHG